MTNQNQIDLATLPCPLGCRWDKIDGSHSSTVAVLRFGKAYIGELQKFTTWRPVFDLNGSLGPWFKDAASAANYMLSALGLSPAPAAEPKKKRIEIATIGHIDYSRSPTPAGRTFTEEQVRKLMAGSWDAGFLQGIETQKTGWSGGVSMGEIRDASVTAALAAATDNDKETAR